MKFNTLLFEVLVCLIMFAFIYYVLATYGFQHFRNRSHSTLSNPPIGLIDAIYFSLVTQSTVGYGSIIPSSDLAKTIVSIQVFSTIVFVLRWSTM